MFDWLISLCVYISSVCTFALHVFCVCVYVGVEGGSVVYCHASLSAESLWTAWVWTHHFFFFFFSPVPPENMQTVFQFRTFKFFMKASIHLKLRSHLWSWRELGGEVVSCRVRLTHWWGRYVEDISLLQIYRISVYVKRNVCTDMFEAV